jgi:hypothetical protein
MNLNELNIFLNEMIGDDSFRTISNSFIIKQTLSLDSRETYWHVEGTKIWKTREWKKDVEYKEAIRKQNAEYIRIAEARKAKIRELIEAIAKKFNQPVDSQLVMSMAEGLLKGKAYDAALNTFGVDFRNIPEFPSGYTYKIIEDRKVKYTV